MSNIPQRYSHFFNDGSPLQIAHSRSAPGIILLNHKLKIVYRNREATELLNNSNPSSLHSFQETEEDLYLPPKLFDICDRFENRPELMAGAPPLIIEGPEKDRTYLSFRVLPMFSSSTRKANKYSPYLIVLIEKIVCPKRWLTSFKLSKRETEVLELLFMGYSNKEIADKLCIAAYTAEDHIKRLIRKFKVKNRLSIVTKFLECQR